MKTTETATVATGAARTIETYLDKLYRAFKSIYKDPAGNVTVETEYDGDGRVKKVSQPYRSGTPVWMQTSYDVLNRPITITNPDSTTVQFLYDDNTAKTTDEAGNAVVRTLNALGHLTKVEELRPSQSTLTTNYTYDLSGGLTGVSQYAAQTRSFTRDWLSRVTSETHPESGTTSYVYDGDGRVTSRTDARNITASLTYDDIDRLLTTSYNDMVTPTVTRTYDQNGYAGLLTTVADGVGSTTYTYKTDSNLMATEARTFTGVTGTFTSSYNYDLEGKLTGITYPSGRQVARTYAAGSGVTAGQLDTVTDSTTKTTVLSNIGDNAVGQILAQTLGNGAVETRSFNSRFQLTGIDAIKSSVPLMDLTYGYGSSNNGRIRTRTDGIQPEHSTNYAYDALQRLTKVEAATSSWSITWGLDDFGNRTSQTPAGLASGRVGTQAIAYSSNKNSGWTYDNAGNVTNDLVYNYTYDGENRLIQINSSAIQYSYDGAGRRVKKTANSVTTYYLYGLTGLMSEFTTSTGASAAASTDRLEYRVGEQTGTAVLLLSQAGTVIENNRVFPFGELWSTPTASSNQQNFTTYLRDGESGLDYAMARHYASRSGRFMTADPGHIGASIGDPQSWNAYVYSRNDSINFTDPSGTTYRLCSWNGGCGDAFDLSDSEFDRFVSEKGYTIVGSALHYYGDPTYYFFRTAIDGSDGGDNGGGDGGGGGGGGGGPSSPRPCSPSRQATSFVAGFLDGIALGIPSATPSHQKLFDLFRNDAVFGSGQIVGDTLSLVLGELRLLYASAAKLAASVVRSGSTAVAARNSLKMATGHTILVKAGLVENRLYSYEQLLAKYGTDDAVRLAAGRTNPVLNTVALSNVSNRLSLPALESCR